MMSDDPKSAAKAALIDAILALDSYDRGYGAALSSIDDPVNIGNFQIVQQAPNADWQPAGFYAVDYKNAATGETIIAYRGTDFFLRQLTIRRV
jgi:hypothetical protein